MNRSAPSTNPRTITRSMAAVSIGAFLAMSAGDPALAWGSGGSGGGSGVNRPGANLAKPILMSAEDRDRLNQALRDAEAIRTAGAKSAGGANSALVAQVRALLAALKDKGYETDREYVNKVARIKSAIEGADTTSAAKSM